MSIFNQPLHTLKTAKSTIPEINSFFDKEFGEHGRHNPQNLYQKNLLELERKFTTIANGIIPKSLFQFKKLPWFVRESFMQEMNFEQYWKFKEFQIESMQNLVDITSNSTGQNVFTTGIFLSRLHLKFKGDYLDKLKNDIEIELAAQKHDTDYQTQLLKKLNEKLIGAIINQPTAELLEILEKNESFMEQISNSYDITSAIEYAKYMCSIYDNVKMEVTKDKTLVQDENNTTLFTITYSDQNKDKEKLPAHYQFEFSQGLDDQQLTKAVYIMLDQAHRAKELTNTHGITIYGFKNNPQKALQIFILCANNNLRNIRIDEETKKAWQEQATKYCPPDPDNYKVFKDALDILDNGITLNKKKLSSLACICQNIKNQREQKIYKNTLKEYWDHIKYWAPPPAPPATIGPTAPPTGGILGPTNPGAPDHVPPATIDPTAPPASNPLSSGHTYHLPEYNPYDTPLASGTSPPSAIHPSDHATTTGTSSSSAPLNPSDPVTTTGTSPPSTPLNPSAHATRHNPFSSS